jgi:hypothetical protein
MIVAAVFLPGILLAQVTTDPLPTVEQLLAGYVEAVGGQAALEELDTRIMLGREITDLPYRGPPAEASLEGAAVYPDRWSLTLTDSVEDRTWCNGAQVWHHRSGDSELKGTEVHTRASFLLDPRGPLRVAEYFPDLRVTGREVVSGREVWVVENDLDPTYNALRFEVESGLLVQIGHYWTLEDYRVFDGVLVPTRISQSRKGGSTTWVWDDVKHNESVDVERFAPPGG